MRKTYLKSLNIRPVCLTALPLLLLGAALAACTETFTDGVGRTTHESEGMGFVLSVAEQGHLTASVGQSTRGLTDSVSAAARRQSDRFVAHPLSGDMVDGLSVHRMPLPFVGIHRGAVAATTAPSAVSRASVSDIVSTDLNFHDSLTVWGFTDGGRKLFDQTMLQKIRGWRSSVQWPYDSPASDTYMQFFALAPSMEDMEITLAKRPSAYGEAPVFTYTLPEPAAQRDLLYGQSDVIDIQAGPSNNDGLLYPGAYTEQGQHLGLDDKFVPLHFQHILTAVRFAQGTIPAHVTIREIRLDNINNTGTFTPTDYDPATGTQGAWSSVGGNTTFTITTDGAARNAMGGTPLSGENIYIDRNQVLFMIPHTLGSSARLEVILEEELQYETDEQGRYLWTDGERTVATAPRKTKRHMLTCPLTGDVWKKGYTMTYKVTVGELEDGYYLIAEPPAAFEHCDEVINSSFPLHSYRAYRDYSDGSADGDEVSQPSANYPSSKYNAGWELVGLSATGAEGPFFDMRGKTISDWLNQSGVYDEWLTPYTSHWLKGISTEGSGYGSQVSFTIDEQQYTRQANHHDILYENMEINSSVGYDLSKQTPNGDVLPESAQGPSNCYIVNRKGQYYIPLQYGKGSTGSLFVDHEGHPIQHLDIEDQLAAHRQVSYANDEGPCDEAEATTMQAVFYDFDNSHPSVEASLLWQDVYRLEERSGDATAKGMVTSVVTDLTHKQISFRISNTYPGNAVIALSGRRVTETYTRDDASEAWPVTCTSRTVSDQSDILWTWHIWMTDEVYKNDGTFRSEIVVDRVFLTYNGSDKTVALQNQGGGEHPVLPVNLGWVPDEMDFGFYSHREVWAKFRQTVGTGDHREEVVVKIEQHARQPKVTGTSTLYQWGRPTALPALKRVDGTARTVYNLAGTGINDQFTYAKQAHYYEFLQHPFNILKVDENTKSWWEKGANYDLWQTDVKTTYDPCPAGFHLPKADDFRSLSLTGASASDGTSLNLWPDASDFFSTLQTSGEQFKGGYFYTHAHTSPIPESERYGSLFYMPCTGRWSADQPAGDPIDKFSDGSAGTFWLGSHASGTKGHALWLSPSYGYTSSGSKKAVELESQLSDINMALPIRPSGQLPTRTE